MADDPDPDRYAAWYSEKLWSLLPGLYRAEDSLDFDRDGPLRELVERIGAQIAVVRRSIDRLWEDQSIETCDDWVIDYIGDLLATNLVASLDARGRRIDVGRTINYRRRKGTVGVLEEIAADVTGWGVRVVEMFRRLGRHRHGLDPAIGLPAPADTARGALQRVQGLVGVRTGTGAGGFADLRDVHGASLAHSAFDEYFHTADVRRGRGATGRYNIPHLGVFVWRLRSFGVLGVTAVQDVNCPNQHTFDPTGRDVPLFAAGDHPTGDAWVASREHEVPGPISRPLLQAAFGELYRTDDDVNSLAVYRHAGGPVAPYDFVPAADVSQDPRAGSGRFAIDPVRGRVIAPVGTVGEAYRTEYRYGFASAIGAGPYDRRIPLLSRRATEVGDDDREPAAPDPAPAAAVTGGDTALVGRLGGLAPTGTLVIDDSLTYDDVVDVVGIRRVVVRTKNLERPLVRLAAGRRWVFRGDGPGATLVLDGLFVSGGADLVLTGQFERVTLACCTLDPGTWRPEPPRVDPWLPAADGEPLAPSRIRIEGNIRVLELRRCIVGPIVDGGGAVAETITVEDSIIQAADPGARALDLAGGAIALARCTVLGAAAVHRADVSETILHGVATVDDLQHGCVRFSAWTTGSVLPRKYESVELPAQVDLFGTRDFGRPAYAQLIATAGAAILEGAEHGSEIGAFCAEQAAIKERSILVKYQEYLPLGLEPSIIHVT